MEKFEVAIAIALINMADIMANLIVVADNLDETHQIESNAIRSLATQIEAQVNYLRKNLENK